MNAVRVSIQRFYQRHSIVIAGVTFVSAIVGGAWYLKQLLEFKFHYSNKKLLSKEESQKYGIEPGKSKTLEDYFEELKKRNIDMYVNKRIKRPWED